MRWTLTQFTGPSLFTQFHSWDWSVCSHSSVLSFSTRCFFHVLKVSSRKAASRADMLPRFFCLLKVFGLLFLFVYFCHVSMFPLRLTLQSLCPKSLAQPKADTQTSLFISTDMFTCAVGHKNLGLMQTSAKCLHGLSGRMTEDRHVVPHGYADTWHTTCVNSFEWLFLGTNRIHTISSERSLTHTINTDTLQHCRGVSAGLFLDYWLPGNLTRTNMF